MRRLGFHALPVAVLLAVMLAAGGEAHAQIPVTDVGNLAVNTQTASETTQSKYQLVISYIQHYMNTIQTYISMVKAIYEADYYGFLMQFLDEFGKYAEDVDVGQWKSDISKARDLYLGYSSSYSQAKSLMEDIFKGESDDIFTDMSNAVEFVGATSIRVVKDIGELREARDRREEQAEAMMNKANGEVGQDRLLQISVSMQGNLLKGQNDIILALTAQAEMMSTELQILREQMYMDQVNAQYESWAFEQMALADSQASPAFADTLP